MVESNRGSVLPRGRHRATPGSRLAIRLPRRAIRVATAIGVAAASALLGLVDATPATAAVSSVNLGVATDGTGPFDSLDANAHNGIVRTHDVVSYVWNYTTDAAGTTNVTFTQTLTAPTPAGVRFTQSNLTQCTGPSGGTISTDGHTITCQVQLSANTSGSIPIDAAVDGTPSNGSTISTNLSATSGGAPVAGGSATTTIAAQPQLNLQKNIAAFTSSATINGVAGRVLNYTAAITEPTSLKGTELVTAPVTWTDDLTQVSPNAQLVRCRVYGGDSSDASYSLPWGKIGITGSSDSTNSVTDSGSVSCTQPSGPGTPIDFTVSGADFSGNNVPTRNSTNQALPVNASFVGTYRFDVFVPNSDITAAGGSINTTNQLRGFDPTSISGQSNFGTGYEPGGDPAAAACPFANNNLARANDNCYSATVVADSAIADKLLVTTDDSSAQYAGRSSGSHAGNGVVAARSTYYARLYVFNTGSTQLNGAAVCDRWDPTNQQITGIGRSWRGVYQTLLTEGVDFTVQYAALPMSSDNDRRTTTCADSAGSWQNSIAAAGGPTAVNAVRFFVSNPVQPNELYIFDPHFTVPADTPNGTIIGDWAGYRASSNTTVWGASTYDKQTNTGTLGDRITVSAANLRLSKNTVPANTQSVLAGNTVDYTMQPQVVNTVTDPNQDPVRNVIVTDQLPACVRYVMGSSSTPVTVTPGNLGNDGIPCTNDTGETGETLVFHLGDVAPNTTLPAITYTVSTLSTTPDGTHIPNTATISSDSAVPQDASLRTAQYDLVVRNVAQFLVSKTVNTPVVEVNDPYSYTLSYRNLTANPVSQAQLIDELPYNGDGRGTNFSGATSFTGFSNVSANVVAECTTDPHGTINPDPNANTNTWSTACPANSTAVRLTATNVSTGAAGAATISFTPTGNHKGDKYVNNIAGARASGTSLLIPPTDNVEVDVIASSIGDFVFDDTNHNGLQDPGETGVPGFPVQLSGTDTQGRPISQTTATGPDGTYSFANLHSGTYTVTFDPAGLGTGDHFTTQHVGTDGTIDSDGNPTTGATAPITLGANTTDDDVDQGIQPAAGLAIAKTVDKPIAQPGDVLTYSVSVTNNGNRAVTNVPANDSLPAGVTYLSTTAPSATLTGSQLTWTVATIAAHDVVTYQVKATVNAGTYNASLVNRFTVTPPPSTPVTVQSPCVNDATSSCATTTTTGPPSLQISKVVDKAISVRGGTLTYTVAISNSGDSDADAVPATDTLPAGLTFVSATGGATFTAPSAGGGGTVTWTANIAAHSTVTYTVVTTVAANADLSQSLVNRFEISAPPAITVTAANPCPAPGVASCASTALEHLTIDKTVDSATAAPGDLLTYTVTVTNDGGVTQSDIAAKDVLPTGLDYVSTTAPNPTVTGSHLTWTIASLAAGQQVSYEIKARIVGSNYPASVTNPFTITPTTPSGADGPPPVTTSHTCADDPQSSCALTRIQHLTIDKVVDDAHARVGDRLTYTVTAINDGGVDEQNITATDTLPTGLTFVSATAPNAAAHDGKITWTIASLAAGQQVSYQVVAHVDAAAAGKDLVNRFAVDPTTPPGAATPPGITARHACTDDPQASCAVTTVPSQGGGGTNGGGGNGDSSGGNGGSSSSGSSGSGSDGGSLGGNGSDGDSAGSNSSNSSVATSNAGSPASTGVPVAALTLLAGILIAVGGMTVLIGRRRRHPTMSGPNSVQWSKILDH